MSVTRVRESSHPLRVLRLTSVFMPPAGVLEGRGRRFDPVGGMQNHTAELTKALDRRNIAQTVLTTRPPGAPGRELVGARAEVVRIGAPIRRLRQLYGALAALHAPGLAAGSDLVHCHIGEDLATLPVAATAARMHGLPLVVTVHCSLRHTFAASDARTTALKLLGSPIEVRGVRAADGVITLTERLARSLQADGVERDRIRVIRPGVDPELFDGHFDDPFPDIRGPRIVFVGRLAKEKGVGTLLEALRHVRVPGAQVALVGDGPERGHLERMIDRLGLGGRVHLQGFLPHEWVPAVLSHADVLVLPSVCEELGSVLIEAMQAGVPIVASNTGGIPTLVADGHNGLLFPPGDPRALAACIDRLLGDESLTRRLAASARRTVAGRSWDVMASEVLEVYQDALGRRAAFARGERVQSVPATL
ncbi:MAG: glycosyltransferase family 4 protein [Actinobacteria bacterium]|nr:glycosyltransferase family 4 protein [Actinomycetota bacterium]